MKHRLDSRDKKLPIRKRIINADSIQEFTDILSEVDWGNLYSISNPNDAYEYFLKIISGIYNLAFPPKTIMVKRKTLQNPWITKALLKLSKLNQKLYQKFVLKKEVHEMTAFIKHINLFLKVYRKSLKKVITQDVLKTIKVI